MAIDDKIVDGGDALVLPAFEERVNAVRGPLTIEGGELVGEERFLNDPFRLPGETNDPKADGNLDATYTNLDGNAVLYDREAFHFSALTGERPGFDPRMNDFPFEFTFLEGPALGRYLDVLSVSREIFSVGNNEAFTVDLQIGPADPADGKIVFSGTAELATIGDLISTSNPNIKWRTVTVSLDGSASQEQTWQLNLSDGTTSQPFTVDVTADSKALSAIAGKFAAQIDGITIGGVTLRAEALVDLLGNSKIRIWAADDASTFTVAFDKADASTGDITLNGTPDQDYNVLFDPASKWTVAAIEVIAVSANDVWDLTLDGTPNGLLHGGETGTPSTC